MLDIRDVTLSNQGKVGQYPCGVSTLGGGVHIPPPPKDILKTLRLSWGDMIEQCLSATIHRIA
jgi:hypothetical protein